MSMRGQFCPSSNEAAVGGQMEQSDIIFAVSMTDLVSTLSLKEIM
jgi:hypothetical protein